MKKVIIGAAFYGRVWEQVAIVNSGLYQTGKFKRGVPYRAMQQYVQETPGFQQFWDEVANAPFMYNAEKQLFLTYDNPLSVSLKTKYARQNGLGGIMFWQLAEDLPSEAKHEGSMPEEKPEGLLDAIYKSAQQSN